MATIVIVGAGGYSFPLRMVTDIVSHSELAASRIVLMDISRRNLRRTERLARRLVEAHDLPTEIVATTDLDAALEGAGYVIVTWQIGGLAAYEPDVEIPRRWGVDQAVGDTHGPGGVFRFLRSYPAYMNLAKAMQRHCPAALLINYANPMAMNCWAVNLAGVRTVGLCHSVQGTSRLLADQAGLPYDQCAFTCFGINHQAWFTAFRHRGKDVYPKIRKALERRFPSPADAAPTGKANVARGGKADLAVDHGDVYHQEAVRTEIMRTFGYFHSESSHHGSEYVAWIRKNPDLVQAYLPERWDYLELCRNMHTPAQEAERFTKTLAEPLRASEEYAAGIIHSMETGQPRVIYGNVPNWGPPGTPADAPRAHLVPNLPQDCCVEVACLVDRNGIQPTSPGALPPQCAAMNLQHVVVQRLAVEAARTGDPMKVLQAVALDPLTAALLTLPQIRAMTAELFAAHRKRLPMFRRVKL